MPTAPDSASELRGLRAMYEEMERAPAIVQPSDFWALAERAQHEPARRRGLRALQAHGQPELLRLDPAHAARRPAARAGHRLAAPPGAGRDRRAARRRQHARGGPGARQPVRHGGARAASTGCSSRCCGSTSRAATAAACWSAWRSPSSAIPSSRSYRGRRISQDLGNSVYELYSATAALPGGELGPRGVLELGGGYGRVAWVFLEEFPDARYVLCDIPPALAVAQRYLTELFPERPHVPLPALRQPRRGRRRARAREDRLPDPEPARADRAARRRALREHQLAARDAPRADRLLPAQADRHTNGFAYLKQWERWHNPEDDVVVARADYPIPATWQTVYERVHPIQRAFFDALYRVPG